MSIIRHVNYFRGMTGHEFAFVFDAEVIDVPNSPHEVRTVAFDMRAHVARPDFVGLVQKSPKGGWGGIVPAGDGQNYVGGQPSKEAAVEAVRAEAALVKAEAAREASDPLYALEKALKAHDWYAHYSDDGSVVRASDQHWNKIKALLALVPADVGEALVAKYRPGQG